MQHTGLSSVWSVLRSIISSDCLGLEWSQCFVSECPTSLVLPCNILSGNEGGGGVVASSCDLRETKERWLQTDHTLLRSNTSIVRGLSYFLEVDSSSCTCHCTMRVVRCENNCEIILDLSTLESLLSPRTDRRSRVLLCAQRYRYCVCVLTSLIQRY